MSPQHGGKRKGAGRRPVFSEDEKLDVIAAVDRLKNSEEFQERQRVRGLKKEIPRESVTEVLAEYKLRLELEQTRNDMHPWQRREAWQSREENSLLMDLKYTASGDEYNSPILPRIIHPEKLTKADMSEIYEAAAQQLSKKFGRIIKRGSVARCYRDWRKYYTTS